MAELVFTRISTRTAGYLAVGVFVLACAVFISSGSVFKMALAIALVLALPAMYLAFARPLIFPFAVYVLLVPFDNIVTVERHVTATHLLGIAAGIALLMWCVRTRKVVKLDWPLAALAALILWMIASTFWSINQPASLSALPTYGGLALLYLALALMPVDFKDFKALLVVAMCAGAAASIYGLYLFYHDPAILSQALLQQRLFIDPNQQTPTIDPNVFADSLLLPCAALIMMMLRGGILNRMVYGGLLAVVVLALVMSSSREAAVALVAILVYYAIRSRHRLSLCFVGVGLLLVAVNAPSSLWARFALGSQRGSIWSVGFEAFKHNWLTGYGIGTFIDAYDRFYLSVSQLYSNGWSSPPHNLAVHYSVELGIVGLGLIGWFFVAQFRSLRKIDRKNPLFEYRLIAEASLLSIVCVSMFIDLFTFKYAWLVFGFVALLRNASLQSAAPVVQQQVQTQEEPTRGIPAGAGAIMRSAPFRL